jgi:outer membrane autotransporter protein
VWLRLVGKDIGTTSRDGLFDVDSDEFLFQAGGDIAQWSVFGNSDRLHLGLMAGYGWGASTATAQDNPARADSDVQGVSVGLYGTWFQNDESRLGWYVDLWGQQGWFTNHVHRDLLPDEQYNSRALALSAETGYAHQLSPRGWVIEPQAQLIYLHSSQDDLIEVNGTSVIGDDGSGWISRLGVRVHRTWANDSGGHSQPYLTLNWWHDATGNTVAFDQIPIDGLYPDDRYEVKLGINLDRGNGWSGWANIGGQWGSQDYHAYIARIGIKYTW